MIIRKVTRFEKTRRRHQFFSEIPYHMGDFVHGHRYFDREIPPGYTGSVGKNGDCRNIHTDRNLNLDHDISDDVKS